MGRGNIENIDSYNKSLSQPHPVWMTDKSRSDLLFSWAPFPEMPHINTFRRKYVDRKLIKTIKVEKVCKSKTWRLSENCALCSCFFPTNSLHKPFWDLSLDLVLLLVRPDSPKSVHLSPAQISQRDWGLHGAQLQTKHKNQFNF